MHVSDTQCQNKQHLKNNRWWDIGVLKRQTVFSFVPVLKAAAVAAKSPSRVRLIHSLLDGSPPGSAESVNS